MKFEWFPAPGPSAMMPAAAAAGELRCVEEENRFKPHRERF